MDASGTSFTTHDCIFVWPLSAEFRAFMMIESVDRMSMSGNPFFV
jgi:hypothetical protein